MWDALLVAAMLLFALQAIRVARLLHSAIWLAGTSALLAVLLYRLGAPYVAVIELSVGAGLVTVLFVFAIGIAGEEPIHLRPLVPRPLALGLALITIVLLAVLVVPFEGGPADPSQAPAAAATGYTALVETSEKSVQVVIWEERGLDMLVQLALIFAGVLGLLGLLAEARAPLDQSVAKEVAAARDRELLALEERVGQQEKELA